MPSPTSKTKRGPLARSTFAERMGSHHGRPVDDFATLAWQCGASWPTRVLRPLIVDLAPRYFDAEDLHLARASECHYQHEIDEEMQLMRVSYLRRGGWRFFGIGLNGARLLRHYDHVVALEVIKEEVARVANAEQRARSSMTAKEGSSP